MPVAIPLIAAAAGAATASALGGAFLAWGTLGGLTTGLTGLGVGFTLDGAASFLASASGFIVATGINAAGGALTASKKKATSLDQAVNSVQDTVRSSVDTQKIIYGQTRVSGAVVFDGATSSGINSQGHNDTGDNLYRHFVIVLAGHEVAEIGTIYLESKPVNLDDNGYVTDAPYVRGATTNTQLNASISGMPSPAVGGVLINTTHPHTFNVNETVFLTFLYKGQNKATGYAISSVPSPTSFTVGAFFAPTTLLTSIGAYVIRESDNTTRFIRVKKFLGTDDQQASPDLLNEISDWTPDHRLRGIAYIYVRIEQAPEFSMNISNISAVVRGKKVYDPRTGLTAWSDNAVLCVRDYFVSDYGFACDDDELNDTCIIAGANVCDEDVLIADGSQKRYTCNGTIDTAGGMFSNLQSLLTSMAGTVTYVQGQFRINPAAYDAPIGHITEDMFAGSISSQARPSRTDLFNSITGTFVDPTQDYVVTNFPQVTNATYEAQDGGDQIPKDIELPFTDDVVAAQRIGKLLLDTSRQGITFTVSLNHSALQFAVNSTVYVTNTRRGWVNKIFRIKKFQLAVPGPFTAILQEEAADAYDWDMGQAFTYDPAPDTNLPDPFIVSPPGVPSVVEDLYQTSGSSGIKSSAVLSWSKSPDRYARNYVLEYRRVENPAWTVTAQTDDTSATLLDTAPGTYIFRVKCVNHIGATSDYASARIELYGLSAPPADITGLTIQGMWGQARLSWSIPTELDVKIGGRILVRHSELATGATWENSTTIGNETVAGNANAVTLPLKAGTYLAKAEDSSGIQSVNPAVVTTKTVSLIAFSDIVTLSEDPAFSGTHSETIADGGILRIAGGTLFDTIGDVDALLNFDFSAGVASSGTYTFADAYTDLTSVQDVRLQSVIQIATENVLDQIDNRQAFIDSWIDFDGTAGGGAVDCWVEVSATDDDPTGSPIWTDYNRIDVADFNLRAFRCRAQLTSSDPAFNALVSTLRVTAKQLTA